MYQHVVSFISRVKPTTANTSHVLSAQLSDVRKILAELCSEVRVTGAVAGPNSHLLTENECRLALEFLNRTWSDGRVGLGRKAAASTVYNVIMLHYYSGRVATGTPQLTGILALDRAGIVEGVETLRVKNPQGTDDWVTNVYPAINLYSAFAPYYASWGWAVRLPHNLSGLILQGAPSRLEHYEMYLVPIFAEIGTGKVALVESGIPSDKVTIAGFTVLTNDGVVAFVAGDASDVRMHTWLALYDRIIEEQLHPYMAGAAAEPYGDAYTRSSNRGPEDSFY